jgi:O-antigen ligase
MRSIQPGSTQDSLHRLLTRVIQAPQRSLTWLGVVLLAALSIPAALAILRLDASWIVVAALGLVFLVIVFLTWPHSGLVLLIGAAGINRFEVSVGGLSVYPEYAALGLVSVLLVFDVLRGRTTWRWPPATWPFAGWLVIGLMASLLHAPDTANSLVLWFKLLLMLATYVVTANLVRERAATGVRVQLVVGGAVAAFGLFALAMWYVTQSNLGVHLKPEGTIAAMGTQWESNVFGSYVASLVVLASVLVVSPVARGLRLTAAAALLIGLPALVASLTRAAWLGAVAALGLALAVWAVHRPRWALRVGLVLGVLVVAASAVLFLSDVRTVLPALTPGDQSTVVDRLLSLAALEQDGNVSVRVQIYQHALQVWQEHPWLGWGIGAYGQAYLYPNQNLSAWIPNLFLHVLYDSGLIGLALLVAGLVVALWRGLVAWRTRADADRYLAGGLLLSVIALLVAFQATEASWLAYFWVYLGLLEGVVGAAPRALR